MDPQATDPKPTIRPCGSGALTNRYDGCHIAVEAHGPSAYARVAARRLSHRTAVGARLELSELSLGPPGKVSSGHPVRSETTAYTRTTQENWDAVTLKTEQPHVERRDSVRLGSLAKRLQGVRTVVLGLGKYGGSLEAIRFLCQQGARVTVVDEAPASRFRATFQRLREAARAVQALHLGHVPDGVLRDAELLVLSPAVPFDHHLVQEAWARGVPVTTEIQLFLERCPAFVIGITGTNGKSTTAVTLYRFLKAAKVRAWIGGNLGVSLLPKLPQILPEDVVILELSSFQLYWLDQVRFSPPGAVITSFAPDHLDRHGDLNAYRYAKQTILRYQSTSDWYVVNADDDDVQQWEGPGRRFSFGYRCAGPGVRVEGKGLRVTLPTVETFLPWPERFQLLGHHQRLNVAAATCAALLAGAPAKAMEPVLERLRPLPHRLQEIATVQGRLFVNDSVCTSPHAAIAAMKSLAPRRIWLIAGGEDKGIPLEPLAEAAIRYTQGVALIGKTRWWLQQLLRQAAGESFPTAVCHHLEEAVQWCWDRSQPGDVILLSPGCASTDMFSGFAHRGRCFVAVVQSLAATVGSSAPDRTQTCPGPNSFKNTHQVPQP
jgi:UDP-N-acetylmuramoylalanine--D-glutamate ligase